MIANEPSSGDRLEEISTRLEALAERLRDDGADAEAAGLAAEAAELASLAGAELERARRAAAAGDESSLF